jgi:hypothetical protein
VKNLKLTCLNSNNELHTLENAVGSGLPSRHPPGIRGGSLIDQDGQVFARRRRGGVQHEQILLREDINQGVVCRYWTASGTAL